MLSKPGDLDQEIYADKLRILISIDRNYNWAMLKVHFIDKRISLQIVP